MECHAIQDEDEEEEVEDHHTFSLQRSARDQQINRSIGWRAITINLYFCSLQAKAEVIIEQFNLSQSLAVHHAAFEPIAGPFKGPLYVKWRSNGTH